MSVPAGHDTRARVVRRSRRWYVVAVLCWSLGLATLWLRFPLDAAAVGLTALAYGRGAYWDGWLHRDAGCRCTRSQDMI